MGRSPTGRASGCPPAPLAGRGALTRSDRGALAAEPKLQEEAATESELLTAAGHGFLDASGAVRHTRCDGQLGGAHDGPRRPETQRAAGHPRREQAQHRFDHETSTGVDWDELQEHTFEHSEQGV